jgi:hypothetical protein
MKPVNLVIVNPEGKGPWLSRNGKNSNDEEAIILFKMRGDETQAERMNLLREQVSDRVILGRDAILTHLYQQGLETPVTIKDRSDWELKKNSLTKITDQFIQDAIEGKRVLPDNLRVEINNRSDGKTNESSELRPDKAKRFSLKRFFSGLTKSPRESADKVRQSASQANPVPKPGFRGLLSLFSKKNVPLHPKVLSEKNLNPSNPIVKPSLATVYTEQTASRTKAERLHEFDPGYTNLTPEDLLREVDRHLAPDRKGHDKSHLRDAVRIQESLWETHGTGTILDDLDVASLDDILATLRSTLKLDLSPDAKQSINVLGKAVSYYQHMQKNKTPGP